MERTSALKKLGKILGKKLGYRINPKAPSAEERAVAKAELEEAVAKRNQLKERRDERYKAILAADVEYQTLHAEHRAASDHAAKLSGIVASRKITVGVSESMFFLVKAEGDSWEEIIDKLEHEYEGVK